MFDTTNFCSERMAASCFDVLYALGDCYAIFAVVQ